MTDAPITSIAITFFVAGVATFAYSIQKIDRVNEAINKYIPVDNISAPPFGMPIALRGKTKAISNPLKGPVSNNNSIYYESHIEQLYEDNKNEYGYSQQWIRLKEATGKDSISFKLYDETGEILVDGSVATIEATHRYEKLVEDEEYKKNNFPHTELKGTKHFRVIELSLPEDEIVNVYGVVKMMGNDIYITGSETYPLIITTRNRTQVIQKDSTTIFGYRALAALFILIGAILVYMARTSQ